MSEEIKPEQVIANSCGIIATEFEKIMSSIKSFNFDNIIFSQILTQIDMVKVVITNLNRVAKLSNDANAAIAKKHDELNNTLNEVVNHLKKPEPKKEEPKKIQTNWENTLKIAPEIKANFGKINAYALEFEAVKIGKLEECVNFPGKLCYYFMPKTYYDSGNVEQFPILCVAINGCPIALYNMGYCEDIYKRAFRALEHNPRGPNIDFDPRKSTYYSHLGLNGPRYLSRMLRIEHFDDSVPDPRDSYTLFMANPSKFGEYVKCSPESIRRHAFDFNRAYATLCIIQAITGYTGYNSADIKYKN